MRESVPEQSCIELGLSFRVWGFKYKEYNRPGPPPDSGRCPRNFIFLRAASVCATGVRLRVLRYSNTSEKP